MTDSTGTSSASESGPELVDLDEQTVTVIPGRVPLAELPGFFDRAFTELVGVVADQQLEIVGPAFARYHGPPVDIADLEVGFPTDRAATPTGEVTVATLPAGRAARIVHHGAFDGLGETWGRLGAWIAEQGLTPAGSMWEIYLTEPSPDMDPDELRTELVWPVDDVASIQADR